MNNFLLLAIIFISAAIGFFVGCYVDNLTWEKYFRDKSKERQDE